MKDLYYILGTDRGCTTPELNAAYQKLAHKLQPGEQENDYFLEEHLREITQAYQILSDPDKRRKYDAAYKKNLQRRLYYFKIKHLNVAATLAFLLITGLFGWYVLRMIGPGKEKKDVKTIIAVSPPPAAVKTTPHHRKKRFVKAPLIVTEQPEPLKDTATHPFIQPEAKGEAKVPADQDNPEKAYSTYLQSNVTGLIYLHEQASYSSAIVEKIPNNSKVRVLEKGQQFYKVAFDERTGYVPKWTVANQ